MSKLTDLFELVIDADRDRVRGRFSKYRVKETANNFLPQPFTDDLAKQGYGRLYGRVRPDCLMKVFKIGSDMNCEVSRRIYCREAQREWALALLREEIDKAVSQQYKDATKVYNAWKKTFDQWTKAGK